MAVEHQLYSNVSNFKVKTVPYVVVGVKLQVQNCSSEPAGTTDVLGLILDVFHQ